MKKKKNNITTFEEHLTERYGTKGTTSRDDFESKAKEQLKNNCPL